ncbi:MAG: formylmethanofuran dehydrogenase subunit C [Planctomycetota bacterium]
MPLELTYRAAAEPLPVELEGFTPDALRGESLDSVRRFPAAIGNTTLPIGELFDVTGTTEDADWRLMGDLSGVHWLGAEMQQGVIHAAGPVGRHTGSRMRGGAITIAGDAGDWLGAEMRGGRIEVAGNAGDGVGAAYAGSPRGMRGGEIRLRGSAGDEVGHTLRRGWIIIAGGCGAFAGYRMKAGSIFVLGACGPRPGAEMVRGTIGLFGDPSPELLPTFRHACRLAPQFLGLMARELAKADLNAPTTIELFNGDLLTGGRGEILLPGE